MTDPPPIKAYGYLECLWIRYGECEECGAKAVVVSREIEPGGIGVPHARSCPFYVPRCEAVAEAAGVELDA